MKHYKKVDMDSTVFIQEGKDYDVMDIIAQLKSALGEVPIEHRGSCQVRAGIDEGDVAFYFAYLRPETDDEKETRLRLAFKKEQIRLGQEEKNDMYRLREIMERRGEVGMKELLSSLKR